MEIRRSLRQGANSAEQILWKFLRGKQLEYKFRRQYSIGNFVVDFYCHTLRLVIELDGWTHDFEKTQNKDKFKQAYLESNGYRVLRITNDEVFGDVEVLLKKITEECDVIKMTAKTPPTVPPAPRGGKSMSEIVVASKGLRSPPIPSP